jgi:formylglycine-generating enzyme required for sulfatase activity
MFSLSIRGSAVVRQQGKPPFVPTRVRRSIVSLALAFAAISPSTSALAQRRHPEMRPVNGGEYAPLYRIPGLTRVTVRDFVMDAKPVTNREFLAFVRSHPVWTRSAAPSVFRDASYLSHWRGDLELGPSALRDQPVTRVSWFAASAYCAARGARLPTEAEWEYAARASETDRDASRDAEFTARILRWYSQPQPDTLPNVGNSPANAWGLFDMHGLVWEWVEDFNTPRAIADSRRASETGGRFCGGAAVNATNVADYAAFMRFAFRSSLRASFTVHNLGFRCAADRE